MQNGIVNEHQLLCNAHTVLVPHRGTAACFYFTRYRPFLLFLCMCLSLLIVLFLFLGASLVCVSLVIPCHDICLYTPLAPTLPYSVHGAVKKLRNLTKFLLISVSLEHVEVMGIV